ncbi:MAG TPA: DUF2721 domain-containing protein [Abditibacteriaceae bacterium]
MLFCVKFGCTLFPEPRRKQQQQSRVTLNTMPASPIRTSADIASAFIGAAITPAVLFTACALLLSGLQGKYSTLVNAVRNLHAERRGLDNDERIWAQARRENVGQQIEALIERARLVRNSLFCLYSGILCLLFASLCGGITALGFAVASVGALVFFAGGMLCVVASMCFGFMEASRSFEIIRLEAQSVECLSNPIRGDVEDAHTEGDA